MTTKFSGLHKCLFLIPLMSVIASSGMKAQGPMPAVLDSADLATQFEYIRQRTNIYNGYRAIREDMFQRLKQNTGDSLQQLKGEILSLGEALAAQQERITSVEAELARTGEERDQAVRNRDSLTFLGIQMTKALYNSIMWIIVLGLGAAVAILFLLFKRSHAVTSATRKELDSVREEFEDYRKNSREKYEKLVVSHHNEIMKLKKG